MERLMDTTCCYCPLRRTSLLLILFTRENADGTRTVIAAAYDYMSHRA